MKSLGSGKLYKKLFSLITDKKFPILVHGPSGTGKTKTILNILEKLNLNYSRIDISEVKFVQKPLIVGKINFVGISDLWELSKIKYFDNLIVESTIEYINKVELVSKPFQYQNSQNPLTSDVINKFECIKVSRTERSQYNNPLLSLSKIRNVNNLSNEMVRIDFFRLLGRIFHKKICINDLCINNNIFYANIASSFGEKKENKKKLIRVFIPLKRQDDNRIKRYQQSKSKSKFIIGSSSYSDDFENLSYYTIETNQENSLPEEENLVVEKIENKKYRSSFNINKVISYLSANIFESNMTLSELADSLDLVSLTDFNVDNTLSLIGAILNRSSDSKGFHKFNSLKRFQP